MTDQIQAPQTPETLSLPELIALVRSQHAVRIAQLENENLILQLRIAHNLSDQDSVDINTGLITRK